MKGECGVTEDSISKRMVAVCSSSFHKFHPSRTYGYGDGDFFATTPEWHNLMNVRNPH
jgi:hypothetical protein